MAAMAWADSKQAGHAVERQQKIYESFRVAILKLWKSGDSGGIKHDANNLNIFEVAYRESTKIMKSFLTQPS